MTVTDVRPVEDTRTPESQNLAVLQDALKEPALVGWDAEIRAAIQRLTGKKAEEA